MGSPSRPSGKELVNAPEDLVTDQLSNSRM